MTPCFTTATSVVYVKPFSVYSSICIPGFPTRGKDPHYESIKASDVIFVGKAVSTLKTSFRSDGQEEILMKVITNFEVYETLKGHTEKEVNVVGKEKGDCGCNYDFEPGVEYIVYAINSKERIKSRFSKYIGSSDIVLDKETREKIVHHTQG